MHLFGSTWDVRDWAAFVTIAAIAGTAFGKFVMRFVVEPGLTRVINKAINGKLERIDRHMASEATKLVDIVERMDRDAGDTRKHRQGNREHVDRLTAIVEEYRKKDHP